MANPINPDETELCHTLYKALKECDDIVGAIVLYNAIGHLKLPKIHVLYG